MFLIKMDLTLALARILRLALVCPSMARMPWNSLVPRRRQGIVILGKPKNFSGITLTPLTKTIVDVPVMEEVVVELQNRRRLGTVHAKTCHPKVNTFVHILQLPAKIIMCGSNLISQSR
jgi:hypothetical protein